MRSGGVMTRWRVLAIASCLALGGAGAAAPPVAAAGATPATAPTAPTQTAACGAVAAGYSTCLVHLWHRAQSPGAAGSPQRRHFGTTAQSSPSGYSPATIAKTYGFSTAGG